MIVANIGDNLRATSATIARTPNPVKGKARTNQASTGTWSSGALRSSRDSAIPRRR